MVRGAYACAWLANDAKRVQDSQRRYSGSTGPGLASPPSPGLRSGRGSESAAHENAASPQPHAKTCCWLAAVWWGEPAELLSPHDCINLVSAPATEELLPGPIRALSSPCYPVTTAYRARLGCANPPALPRKRGVIDIVGRRAASVGRCRCGSAVVAAAAAAAAAAGDAEAHAVNIHFISAAIRAQSVSTPAQPQGLVSELISQQRELAVKPAGSITRRLLDAPWREDGWVTRTVRTEREG